MTPQQFVDKWRGTQLTEKAASHEHFIDLCHVLGEPTPAEADPSGHDYCFEKSVYVVGAASKGSKGDAGFVDVWKRGCFAWEYKRQGQYKDLSDAYRQVYQYRDALDNPPLTIVSDIDTIEIRTHFSGYPTDRKTIRLPELPGQLDTLRRVFRNPETFRPFKTRATVTTDAANEFGKLADSLISRFTAGRNDPAAHNVAHFLMKLMFCLFVEDIELLPGNAFTRLINRSLSDPESFPKRATELFQKMRDGGDYGNEVIPWFNGGLFDDAPPMELKHGDIMTLQRIAQLEWGGVEPSIFGTLFERILDPAKRAQIGAHYTSKDDIMLVIEPVIMQPLRRQWAKLQQDLKPDLDAYLARPLNKRRGHAESLEARLDTFRQSLSHLRVLDPACGSGNFLYVALQQLLDFDEEITRFATRHGIALTPLPYIKPTQMHGIEINPYAAELAQVVIWIGYLQWLQERALDIPNKPILDKLECIENRDAILDLSDPKNPAPAKWPEADFIVGNPPFLGGSLIRSQLGSAYFDALQNAFALPMTSDLCCYWFALASSRVEIGTRVGLLATQAIRGSGNRDVLELVKRSGGIFAAWSDRPWMLDGAAVNVAIIAFDNGAERTRLLDGVPVAEIHSNLHHEFDAASARALPENVGLQHEGDKKGGAFELPPIEARRVLADPHIGGTDLAFPCKPWVNGNHVNGRWDGQWIIDFEVECTMADAASFPLAFELVSERVGTRYGNTRSHWWIHERARPSMRRAIASIPKYLVTTRHSKHRMFTWVPGYTLPDSALIVFARTDCYFMGCLQSSVHVWWALRMGTQLEDRPRYTPTTCFETFPLPWPPGKEDTENPAYKRISEAAKELNDMRERWLNPPEWIDPLAAKIDATDDFSDVPAEARPLIRHSAIMSAAAKDSRLKKRTLTNLYNERPTWLKLAHEKLDRAVLAAYAHTDPTAPWSEDYATVFTDTGPGQPLPAHHELTARRAEVERLILENLLRLNGDRAKAD